MKNYKLLTPGPLTTTETVKREMLFDHCTWDDDYKVITQNIRRDLLEIGHVNEEEYTTILMQGSGSFGVESVISSVIGKEDKCLFLTNGAYGERAISMAKYHNISFVQYDEEYNKVPDVEKVISILEEDKEITHIMMIHCETTSGILNNIEEIGEVAKKYNKTFIVDAMSSFGGVDIPVKDYGIDFLISSANKCIQGVPGFAFIIANKKKLMESKGKARSLCLDLYDQWMNMDNDGKWRFTSPTHVVLAFSKAIEELKEEGGVVARNKRYSSNNKTLISKMKELGFESYLDEEVQSPIITTFLYNGQDFTFEEMYKFIKENGYAIYPGKLTKVNTFRIGNIGEIYEEDINNLIEIFKKFLGGRK